MKKLLYLALVVAIAAGFSSCDDNDDVETPNGDNDIDSYVGTLAVTNGSDSDIYYKNDVKFEFDDDTNTLTMWEVAFIDGMPSVDIIVVGIPEFTDDVYKASSITATLADGEPAPSYISDLSNVSITETNDTLSVGFSVDVTFGTTTTYTIVYLGDEVE